MSADNEKSERLAAALRANLARRKAQARARRAPPDTPAGTGGAPSGGNPAIGGDDAPRGGEPEIVPKDEPG